MRLLNLCAGATRPQSSEWTNLDQLHPVLAQGTPERAHLDGEANYVEFDVLSGPLPFNNETFDGILASHCVEHWECNEGARIMKECRRALKNQGILLVSVPDSSYFRMMHNQDTVENAERLFGEPIHLPDGETTFLGYGGFNKFHKVMLSEDPLWTYFIRAGFDAPFISRIQSWELEQPAPNQVLERLRGLLNRLPFSLVMAGVKA